MKPIGGFEDCAESEKTLQRAIPGSTAFVPSVVGLIIASEVIKEITGITNDE